MKHKTSLPVLLHSLFSGTSDSEKDSSTFSELCMIIMRPGGTENIREIVSRFSNESINLVIKMPHIINNQVLGHVYQMFIIERAYRNGFLENDWKWEWDSNTEGHIRYLSSVSFEQMLKTLQKDPNSLFSGMS